MGVETLRAEGDARRLGEALWEWGTPTAASVHYCVEAGLTTIATGGVVTGLDVARSLALGAQAAGIARPVYQAWREGGREGALRFLMHVEAELRAVMLLTGCRTVAALHTLEPVIVGELRDYVRPGVSARPASLRPAASEVSA